MWPRGVPLDWETWGKVSAVGGLSGLAAAAVGVGMGSAMRWLGTRTGWEGSMLATELTLGIASSTASNLVSQQLEITWGLRRDQKEIDWGEVGTSALGGALGGLISWKLTRGLYRTTGPNKGTLKSNISSHRYVSRVALASGLGGMAGDALNQVYQNYKHERKLGSWELSIKQLLWSGVTSAATSIGTAMTQHALNHTCFAAETPLLTPEGSKRIEDFRVGDLILSRDEHSLEGPVEAKQVEEVFVRTGRILQLHVGGQLIRTTPEHHFFVRGKGWTAAGALEVGDLLGSHDGSWVEVGEVVDTGDYQTVYNLRVADYHTYFVGSQAWGCQRTGHTRG